MEAEKNVRDFGAVGDGKADDTLSLRAALEAAAARGGGVVRVGAGTYRTGPLTLESGVELRVDAGAVLSFIPEFERYEPVRSRWEGVECWCMRPLLFARDARNVALTGGGTLDGNGAVWWNAYRAIRASGRKRPETDQELELARLNPDYLSQPSGGGGRETQFLRPPMVHFLDCRDVRIENVRLMNTPYWNTHLYCRGIVVRGVLFRNPTTPPTPTAMNLIPASPPCGGLEFDVGDDCMGLNPARGGRRSRRPLTPSG
jgi:polygalacturonase